MNELKNWLKSLTEKMKTFWEKIKDFIDDKKDIIWAVVISVACYFIIGFLQSAIGIGGIDFIVFLKPIYAAFCLFVGSASIWLLLKVSWKSIAKYYQLDEFFEDWKLLEPRYRVIISIVIWLSYLYFFVQIVQGGIGTWMS